MGADDEVDLTGCFYLNQGRGTFTAAEGARCDLVNVVRAVNGTDHAFFGEFLALSRGGACGEQGQRSQEEGGQFDVHVKGVFRGSLHGSNLNLI